MRKNAWPGKAALSIGLATGLLYTLGCGVGNTPPKPPMNTYLYVGAVSQLTPINPSSSGSITQFKVESDGALTTLNVYDACSNATGVMGHLLVPPQDPQRALLMHRIVPAL